MVELDRIGGASVELLSMIRDGSVTPKEVEFLSYAFNNVKKSSAQLFQDLWVLFELNEKRNGYFVEFGAADGEELSNTVALERFFGWKGALAEACPHHLPDLKRRRSASFVSDKGIGPENGQFQLTIADDPLLSTFAAFSQTDHLTASRAGGKQVTVEVQTLNRFLDEAAAPNDIDFLSVRPETCL